MATDVSIGFQNDQELKSMRAGTSDLIRYSTHALASQDYLFLQYRRENDDMWACHLEEFADCLAALCLRGRSEACEELILR